MQFKHTQQKGFTIVEVLISLTIFSIAVAGVITVAAQGGLHVNAAKDKLTATYLADEGIELMRALRDTYVVGEPIGSESDGWNAFVANFPLNCNATTPCDIDVTNAAGGARFPTVSNLVSCVGGPGALCPIYYTYPGYYNDQGGIGSTETHFTRGIVVESVLGSPDEMRVTVTVEWKQGTLPQSVVQTENIFNWY